MLSSNLCFYSDVYIFVSANIAMANTAAGGADQDNKKYVIATNCNPFTNCISEMHITQIDNAKNIDLVILMYKLMDYSNNCSKTFGILW